jgi:hypothetical protein
MTKWQNDRYCMVDHHGVETPFNVNRLTKQNPWDEKHSDTMKSFVRAEQKELPPEAEKVVYPVKIGEFIVFPMEPSDGYPLPFGVGKVTNADDQDKLVFQWYGNTGNNATGTFRPIRRESSSTSRTGPSITPIRHLADGTAVGISNVIARGFDKVVNASEKLTGEVKQRIIENEDVQQRWSKEMAELFQASIKSLS